jgi:transcription-repair coupling factor (superfamily II helicase)
MPPPVASRHPDTSVSPADPSKRLADLIASRGVADVTGLSGAERGWVARGLLAPGRARLLLAVTADEEGADELARDLAFFLGRGQGAPSPILRVPADPVLPYDDLSPDRGLEMERLAALARLHLDPQSVRAVVVSARALARRTVPRATLERHTELAGKGMALDREAFAARLVALGYTRVPLVEDPGTFAVRGGIVDVWSPYDGRPVRFELFGDEVEGARAFDPESQRTAGEVEEVVLLPAREALFTDDCKEAAKAAVREAAERVNRPTSRVREVLDAIDGGNPFFGQEALLPGFHAGGLGALFDYLPAGTWTWVEGPDLVSGALSELDADLAREHEAALRREDLALPPSAHFLSAAAVEAQLARGPCVRRHAVWLGTEEPVRFQFGETSGLRAEIEGSHGEEGALGPLARRLDDWRRRGLLSVVACSSPSSADRLRRLLEDRRLAARVHGGALPDPPSRLYDPAIHAHLLQGEVTRGFVDAEGRLALLSEEEIFGKRVRKRTRAARVENQFAAAFRDLNEGDLVVHVEHGIARYLGLTKMQIRGVEGDFLVLAYEGADRLYLPVSKLRQVQKFTGAAPEAVRLDRLGGSSFALRKARVKEQLLKMAAELLDVYAARVAHPGFPFPSPDENFREFEAEFPYEPTPDQAKAIEDVLADMTKRGRRAQGQPEEAASERAGGLGGTRLLAAHPGGSPQGQPEEAASERAGGLGGTPPAAHPGGSPQGQPEEAASQRAGGLGGTPPAAVPGPMDRLVCGDVGYGKTEVAMRAAMLSVLAKKQVAVLVPTTVLAAQHERTFRERFKGYPVRIEAVSRMKDEGEVRAALRDLGAGKVDVVVGTHRLLAADVSFKDLGLLVVDEEQRFGVAHKERLKKLRKLVDVLTLTATPIPRTLHMSLAGARDLSIIATPPEDRRAIRTFVVKFDPGAVREAIQAELKRGGQVFFVHNRVRSIAAMEKFLRELVPEARVGVAHGQMAEGKLEEVMSRFVDRELDVLLSTSIIESGLDIPSANTIIVNRADQFGLAQLYQIRGRVGRSRERAYAYLLVPARRPITPDARKRLEALQRFSELGAGFQIASHDLEIRGAGNLLGKDQSGQIEAIGFDLYTELLDEAVRELRGEAPREEIDPDIQLPVPAFIPDPYMPDVHQRLFFYKRFAQASTDEELDDIRAEIVDRYGDPPDELDALQSLMAVKVRLRALRIRALEAGPGRLVFTLGDGAALDPFRLAKRVQASGGALRLTPDMKLVALLEGRPEKPRATRAGGGTRAEKVSAAVARAVARARPSPAAPPPTPTPAQEAAHGREILAAVRRVLDELTKIAK